jgi:hypothetical protein
MFFLPEDMRSNSLSPKSEMMTFIGLSKGTKGYTFMRSPNNNIFTTIQALFDQTLFPKCPNMCHPGYTPVGLPPDDLQGEHNGPPDSENGKHGVDYHLFQWDQQAVRCHGSICSHSSHQFSCLSSSNALLIHLYHLHNLPVALAVV